MRIARLAALTTVLVGTAIGGALLAINASGDPAQRGSDTPWSSFAVSRYGVSGALPEGWRLAAKTLTPHLDDPREIVSAGTFAFPPAEPGCNMLPVAAVRAMGPGDALVSVQERGKAAPVADFPARPARFSPAAEDATPRLLEQCLGAPLAAHVSSLRFRDGERAFHAFVVVGARADEAAAFAVLERLRFDPGFRPAWAFAG
jgi:hypothetical protein